MNESNNIENNTSNVNTENSNNNTNVQNNDINTNIDNNIPVNNNQNIEKKEKSNNLLLPILLVLAGGVLVWQLYFVPLDTLSNDEPNNPNQDTQEETKKEDPNKEDVSSKDSDKDDETNKEEENDLVFDNDLITFKYSKALNIVSEKKDCPGELLILTDIATDETKEEKPGYTIKFTCNELSEGFTTIEDIYEQNKKYYQDNNITNYTLEIKELNGNKVITGILPDTNGTNEYKIITFYDTKNKKIYEFTTFWKSEIGYSELDKISNTITLK